MQDDILTTEISRHIWDTKYRYRKDGVVQDTSIENTWHRIAQALAASEADRAAWEERFSLALKDFAFLPGGRILAGAGTDRKVTLFNCFVMGTIDDSMDGIFDALKEGAITMQQGGGVGYDFSPLRASGMPAHTVDTIASGPVSFMHIWDSMCSTILSTGARRGAMMGALRIDHPDIEAFIGVKSDSARLRHFNLSVLVSDAFMTAVRNDTEWPLVFPADTSEPCSKEILMREWPGYDAEVPCCVVRRIRARDLWDRIMRANYDYAEPGVLFIDRINQMNNLRYCERISATNPCGEIPLPPYGACNLGSLNLAHFVHNPFTVDARLDMDALSATVHTATRMLDNVIDVSRFPLEQQARKARDSRRIGLGITGLADMLIMLGTAYDSEEALHFAADVMRTVCHAAYRASVSIAREKGPFPLFDRDRYLEGEFIRGLPEEIQEDIARHGIRNSHVTAIAPTGTISLLANNISSGLEPVYDYTISRKVLNLDGTYNTYDLVDYAWKMWHQLKGDTPLPPSFQVAGQLPPEVHVDMQAALQPYVDNAISKTINIPPDFDFDAFRSLYEKAYDKGLKGCTTFRPNPVTGRILVHGTGASERLHCCGIEREAD